jgi:hypothetical protein
MVDTARRFGFIARVRPNPTLTGLYYPATA